MIYIIENLKSSFEIDTVKCLEVIRAITNNPKLIARLIIKKRRLSVENPAKESTNPTIEYSAKLSAGAMAICRRSILERIAQASNIPGIYKMKRNAIALYKNKDQPYILNPINNRGRMTLINTC